MLLIRYEQFADGEKRNVEFVPLFKELRRQYSEPEALTGVPVIAFHSYKGGVGRTLSMIATVRALSKRKKSDHRPFRLLLVDGDFEVPGLTRLAEEQAERY